MKSKTSSFNGWFNAALFRKDLSRFWPLWLLYALIWVVMMPILQYTSAHGFSHSASFFELQSATLSMAATPALVMSAIFGLLFAMAMFSYLDTARSVGLMHTLPIRREGLYITNYCAGLFMLTLTHLAVFLATAVVHASTGLGVAWAELGTWLAVNTGLSLFFYSFGCFCALFTGQILAVPVFYGILNILAVGMDFLVRTFVGLFLYGISSSGGYSALAMRFSPLVELARTLLCGSEYGENGPVRCYLEEEGLPNVALYAAVGLALALVGLFIARVRRSETAGDTVSILCARPIFKYGVAVCSALGLGQALYLLTWGQFFPPNSQEYSLPGVLACMAVMGLAGYFAAEMLLKKSFRVLRSGWKGAVVLTGVLIVFAVTVSFDLLGVERRVPDAGSVESVEFYLSGYNYFDVSSDSPAVIDAVLAAHGTIVGEKDDQLRRHRENDRVVDSAEPSPYTDSVWVNFDYTLTSGSVFSRSYQLLYNQDDLTVGSAAALNALLSQPAVIRQTVLPYDDVTRVSGGYFQYYVEDDRGGHYEDYQLSSQEAAALYAAVEEDADAGRLTFPLLDSISATQSYVNCLELDLYRAGFARTFSMDVTLLTTAVSTVAKLKELGIVTAERTLITQAEQEAAYDGEKAPFASDAPVAAEKASAAIGIIGGADGPTEIFVSG